MSDSIIYHPRFEQLVLLPAAAVYCLKRLLFILYATSQIGLYARFKLEAMHSQKTTGEIAQAWARHLAQDITATVIPLAKAHPIAFQISLYALTTLIFVAWGVRHRRELKRAFDYLWYAPIHEKLLITLGISALVWLSLHRQELLHVAGSWGLEVTRSR